MSTPSHREQVQHADYRVIKTLRPEDRGARALAQQYGYALVCVRHRADAKGKVRHTTVELLIDSTPIRPRTVKLVAIKTEPHERKLNELIETAGGVWDSRRRLWRLPRRVAGILKLTPRIVKP